MADAPKWRAMGANVLIKKVRLEAPIRNLNGVHWAVLGQALSSVTNLFITLVITSLEGVQIYAQYTLYFLLALFYRNVMDGALLHPIGSIGPKIGERSSEIYRGFVFVSFIGYLLIITLTFLLLFLASRYFIDIEWMDVGYFVSLLFILSIVCTEMFRNYLLIFNHRFVVVCCDVTRCILQVSFLALAIWWRPGDVANILAAVALGGFLSIAPFISLFGKTSIRFSKWKTFFFRHARYVRWAIPSIVFRYAQTNVPFYWAASVLGAEVIGAARAIQSVANVINIPLNGLRSILPAISARIYRRQGAGAMTSYLFNLTLLLSVINAVAVVFFVFTSGWLVDYLFGPTVANYAYMLWIYVATNALMAVNMTLTAGFQALEEPKILAIRFLLGFLLSLVLSYLFLEEFGAIALPSIQMISAIFSVVFFLGSIRARAGKA